MDVELYVRSGSLITATRLDKLTSPDEGNPVPIFKRLAAPIFIHICPEAPTGCRQIDASGQR
jgi:hypothetical protein